MDHARVALGAIWPFFNLVIRTPRLELKLMLEHELADLANRVVTDGVHDGNTMPFHDDWALWPAPDCQRRFMKAKWLNRGQLSQNKFSLTFGVYRRSDDLLMGCFDLSTKDMRLSTYSMDVSWLLKPYQDERYGQEAGQALLHLIFEYIGADRAEACHWHDNPRSGQAQLAVGAEHLGDEWRMRQLPNGIEESVRMCFTRITTDTWQRPMFTVEVDGFEECRDLFCPKPDTGELPRLGHPDEYTAHVITRIVPIRGVPDVVFSSVSSIETVDTTS